MGAAGADGVPARVRARVAERFPADLERIRDHPRLPSVSATGEGVRETAAATLGRGSANSKGGLAAFFVAVEVLRELDALPVSLALLVEGEEELSLLAFAREPAATAAGRPAAGPGAQQ